MIDIVAEALKRKGSVVAAGDPRKRIIMDKLKQESRGQRVTKVLDHGDGVFSGHCFRRVEFIHWEWRDVGRYWAVFEQKMFTTELGQHIDGGEIP